MTIAEHKRGTSNKFLIYKITVTVVIFCISQNSKAFEESYGEESTSETCNFDMLYSLSNYKRLLKGLFYIIVWYVTLIRDNTLDNYEIVDDCFIAG